MKIYLYGAGAIFSIILLILSYHFGYTAGQKEVQIQDATAFQKAEQRKTAIEDSWRGKYEAAQADYQKELASLQDGLAAHPIGPIRLCLSAPKAPAVPSSAPSGASGATEGGSVQRGPEMHSVGPDIGSSLDMLAAAADRLVASCRFQKAENLIPTKE